MVFYKIIFPRKEERGKAFLFYIYIYIYLFFVRGRVGRIIFKILHEGQNQRRVLLKRVCVRAYACTRTYARIRTYVCAHARSGAGACGRVCMRLGVHVYVSVYACTCVSIEGIDAYA